MKPKSLILLLTFWFSLLACSDSHTRRNVDGSVYPFKYKFGEDGVDITLQGPEVRVHGEEDSLYALSNPSIDRFNRGGKRGHTIMVTGDLPCFAQMRAYPQNTLNPDLFKLGDGRIRITYGENSFFLDSLKDVITFFLPGITSYKVKIPGAKDLTINLAVFHAGNWGVAAKLEITNNGEAIEQVGVEFLYGGLRRCGRTHDAAYFRYNNKEEEGNTLELIGGMAIIGDSSVIDKVGVTTIPKTQALVSNGRAIFSKEFLLERNARQSFCLITSYGTDRSVLLSKIDIKDLEDLLAENTAYYDSLLNEAVISTPSKMIDGAFRTALINLDNVYTDSAWLEGVHWWNAYFTNLFQISAAISLDQKERARNALIFYNSSKTGPAPAMKPNKLPEEGTEDDGLNYYVYALMQYLETTGDTALLQEVWPDVIEALKRIMRQKDPDGDNLLYWQFGCNIFLYQADLLGMPGKSASPSIMTSGMMERLASYGKAMGKQNDAEWLSTTSSEIERALMTNLWNSQEGCFYNHIDLQQIPHMAHYYTDHVFSTLYSSMEPIINWQCLSYLNRTLIKDNFEGKPTLMKVGNLQGKLFGNDNVMPTQMAEAARAFYKIGDQAQATSFLESVARAGTIYTDAPGNFPERMSDEGKGESNYLFGNPIGSYIYAVVNGLFGLELEELGKTLHWQPGFPDNWDHASLQLSYADIHYNMKSKGSQKIAMYTANYPSERSLRFSVFLPPGDVHKVTCNEKEIAYEIHPGLNRIELILEAAPSLSHKIKLVYSPASINETDVMTVVEASSNRLQFNQPVIKVEDPQCILEAINIDNGILDFKTYQKTGEYTLYVQVQDPNYYVPVKLKMVPPLDITCDTIYYDVLNRSLSMDIKMLNNTNEDTWSATAMVSGFHCSFGVDSDLENSKVLVFHEFPLPVRCIENVEFSFQNDKGESFQITKRMAIAGFDELSTQSIFDQRMKNLRSIAISSLFNSNTYLSMFPWGRDIQPLHLSFAENGKALHTNYGSFEFTPSENSMLLVELGRSDAGTRETVPTMYAATVEIPVGIPTSEVDLLYFSEVESRNTGTHVGNIALIYSNSDTTFVPLVVGKNMDFFKCYTARDAFPMFFDEDLEKISSYDADRWYNQCCTKHLNFLPLSCDHEKTLKSVQITMEAADAQFGLIGMNCLE